MASADTNVLLRWALDDLPEQSDAANRLLNGGSEVQVADAAIIEAAYVLEKVYGFERSLVAGYIKAIMALGQVNCNRALFSRVLPLYEQHKQLSMTDCCLAMYAELNNARPLHTFDKKLAGKLTPAVSLLA